MPSCPACGRPLGPGAVFCTACGAAAPAPAPAPTGPPGKTRSPVAVPLLGLVTLGVYVYVWGWKVTREVDAWAGDRGAHRAYRKGVALAAIGAVAFAAALAVMLVWLGPVARGETADPFVDLDERAFAAFVLLAVVAGVLAVAGTVYTYVGFWRVWTALETDERRRGVPPLSPALMLVLVLVPYVNLVGFFVMPWRTQKGLNDAWAASPPPVIAA